MSGAGLHHDLRGFVRLLATRREFRRLWLSNLVSLLGDWFSYVAVTTISLVHGAGAVSVAMVFVAHALPVAVLAPIAGPLADRFDRRSILLTTHVTAAGLTGAMYFAASAGSVGLMQGLLLLRVSVSSVGLTARSAAVPQLVEPAELHAANALHGLSWSVLFAGGVALGGVVAAAVGPSTAILIDAGSFLVAAAIVARLPALRPPAESHPPLDLRQLRRAWEYARPRPRLLAALLSKSPMSAVNASSWVTLSVVAGPRTGLGAAAGIGLLHGARAIGTGVGPLLPPHWLPREANIAGPLLFLGVAAFAWTESLWIGVPALLIWGMGTGHNWVASTAEIQMTTPGAILGRMTALDFLFMSLTQTTMALCAGALIDATADPRMGAACGLAVGVLAWLVVMSVRARGRRLA